MKLRPLMVAGSVLLLTTLVGCTQQSGEVLDYGTALAPGVSSPSMETGSATLLVQPGDIIAIFSTAGLEERSYEFSITVQPAPTDLDPSDLSDEAPADISSDTSTPEATPTLASPDQAQSEPPGILGDREQFWVPRFSDVVNDLARLPEITVQVTGVLKAVGVHADVYVDVNSQLTETDADAIAKQFDEVAYPIVTEQFGNPPAPGGRERVVILLSPMFNGGDESELNPQGFTFGMFNDADQLDPASEYPVSNYRNVLHINPFALISTDREFVDPDKWRSILSHEFQHMVNYNYHQDREAVAIDEGKAMLSEILSGFGLPAGDPTMAGNLVDYQRDPASVSLLQGDYGANPMATYGMGLFWVTYLYDRFGPETLNAMATHPEPGVKGAAAVTGIPPEDLFTQWVQANILAPASQDSAFSYTTIDTVGNGGGTYFTDLPGFASDDAQTLVDGESSRAVPAYGVEYLRATAPRLVRITGEGIRVLVISPPGT